MRVLIREINIKITTRVYLGNNFASKDGLKFILEDDSNKLNKSENSGHNYSHQ